MAQRLDIPTTRLGVNDDEKLSWNHESSSSGDRDREYLAGCPAPDDNQKTEAAASVSNGENPNIRSQTDSQKITKN
jgi:hypothetical protein